MIRWIGLPSIMTIVAVMLLLQYFLGLRPLDSGIIAIGAFVILVILPQLRDLRSRTYYNNGTGSVRTTSLRRS